MNTLKLKPNNDTTFGLYRKEEEKKNTLENGNQDQQKTSSNAAADSNNNVNCEQKTQVTDDSPSKEANAKNVGNLKNRLKMFESNYELKFNNKLSK